MEREYDLLLSLTTPLGMVSDLGLAVRVSSQGVYSTVVQDQGELWVADHGFLALDENSMFISGSCVDFLALHESLKTGVRRLDAYRAAVGTFIRMYGHKLPIQRDDAAFAERMASEAYNRRRIFNAIMFPVRSGINSSAEKVCLENKLQHLGIDMHTSRRVVVVLETADWINLKERCDASGIEIEVPDGARIVYPFFRDFSTLASIFVEHPTGIQFSKHIHFNPSRIAYSGMLNMYPSDEIYLAGESTLAAVTLFSFRRAGKPAVCLGTYTDRTKQGVGWKPANAKYLIRKTDSDFRKPATMSLEGIKIEMLPAQTSGEVFSGNTEPWNTFIVDCIREEIVKTRHISPKAKLLLESCHLDPSDRHKLTLRLNKEGLHPVSDVINQMFHDGILLENNQVRIITTDSGYKYQKQFALDSPPEELTNFTMELLANATFPEDANVYHRARVTLRGQTFDTVIKHDDLETARKLDKSIKAAEMSENAGQQTNRITPVISELNVGRFLIPYFREVTSKLPSEEGVSILGWNGPKTLFHGPGFCVSKGANGVEINTSARVKHPGLPVLNAYNFKVPDQAIIASDMPHELSDIISQFCAMLGRAYHGYSVKPVAIRNTPSAAKILRRLFTSIGQTSVLELNSNQRLAQDIPGIKGFPVLATGYNRQQIRASRLPLFMLADYGTTIPENIDDAAIQAAEGSIRMLLQKVVHMVLSSEGAEFKRVHSLSYENELVREGAHIICKSAGIKAWPISATPYEAVEKVLRSIPVGDVRKYFAHDLSKQVVYFYHNITPDKSSKNDLVLELSPLVGSLKDGGDHLIMDAVSALEILQNFYHEQVQLEPVNLPGFMGQDKSG